ncbi:MAG: restriction endonuclease subunit S [Proteobacteria bacterium]|nr:restriction endonuclease subunit S [Pseudomonadota bacterium]
MIIPPTWMWRSVSELSAKVTDGVHKKPTYIDNGVPFLTVGNLTAGPGIDFSTTRFVSEDDHAEYCKRTYPERDDILVTKDGTLGVVRRIETDQPFSIFVSLALVKLVDKRQSPYVSLALASPHLQIQMKGVGTGLQHIHLTDLRKDLLPLPPLDEQAEIVRRVESLFAFADRLEARLQTAQSATERLTPALLAKAFRGELVPQDPNDEPASELLRRLQQDAPSSSTRRGRKSAA